MLNDVIPIAGVDTGAQQLKNTKHARIQMCFGGGPGKYGIDRHRPSTLIISSHLAAQLAWGKVGAERRLQNSRSRRKTFTDRMHRRRKRCD
jgi:hypothetical protein